MAAADNTTRKKGSGFNTPAVVLGGVAVLVLVWALSLFIRGGFEASRQQARQTLIYEAPAGEEITAALAEQRAILTAPPHWVDKEAGKVGLPIDEAKDLLVKKLMGEGRNK